MLLRKITSLIVALAAVLPLSGVLAGCSTSRPETAHYRGDSVYGDSGKAKKDRKKGKDSGKRGGGSAQRPRVDPGLFARARGIAGPMERALVEEASRWIGTPYLYGGSTRSGADCSGFVLEVYRQVCGVKMPRSSAAQSEWCQPVAPEQMHPGDLVFFSADGSRVSHVGMFIGSGQMIHASSSRGVVVSDLDNPYWLSRFYSIGRVASAGTAWKKRTTTDGDGGQPQPSAVPRPQPDVNLLDLAISEKADSIFGTTSPR